MNKVLLLEANQSQNTSSVEKTRIKNRAENQPEKPKRFVKFQGCNEPQRASGFCGPHYGRWRRAPSMVSLDMMEISNIMTSNFSWKKIARQRVLDKR